MKYNSISLANGKKCMPGESRILKYQSNLKLIHKAELYSLIKNSANQLQPSIVNIKCEKIIDYPLDECEEKDIVSKEKRKEISKLLKNFTSLAKGK
jgi:hypothetical protein